MDAIKNWLSRGLAALELMGSRLTLTFFIIFALSVGIRVGLLLSPYEGHHINYRATYKSEAEQVGVSIVQKGMFADPYLLPSGPTAHTPPFYPFLLAGVYRIFGAGNAASLVRCALIISAYSLLYALMPLLARALGLPVAAGVLGGLFSAVVPLKRAAEIWLGWDEPYAALATAGLLVLTLRIWKTRKLDFKTAVVYGLSWGLTFYMAPALAPVLMAICVVHVIRFSSGQRLRAVQWWGVAFASVVLVVLPWTLRNYHQFGAWIFIRDNLGLELYVSNHDLAQPVHGLNLVLRKQAHPSDSLEAARKLVSVGEIAYNHELRDSALVWIASHPARFLSLTLTRAFYFWTGSPEHPETLIVSGLLSILAFAGLMAIRREGEIEKATLIATVWVVYPLIYYVVQYLNRYRVPMDWTITLPAAVFVYQRLKAAVEKESVVQESPAEVRAGK